MRDERKESQHVFIVGSKGIPAQYGGFETFVEKLTKYNEEDMVLHVACMSDKPGEFIYNEAECVQIKVPKIGAAKAVYYDCAALERFIHYCYLHPEMRQPVFYVLTCRIGFRIHYYRKKIHELGGKLYINPDGHEWKRRKWCLLIRWYWKISEMYMVKNADMLVCDSKNIEAYMKKEYARYNPRTTFIPYGSERVGEKNDREIEKLQEWFREKKLEAKNYYLIVGRFVPENNYETIIREFMSSDTSRKLAIITGNNNKLMKQLKHRNRYDKDNRICFVGTVYDQELLQLIRKHAFAYIHGHEVGGTNPSLLEAMSCTETNLLLDVGFNREVGGDAALYWEKKRGSLRSLIQLVENLPKETRMEQGEKAKQRMWKYYGWTGVIEAYRLLFSANRE